MNQKPIKPPKPSAEALLALGKIAGAAPSLEEIRAMIAAQMKIKKK